MKDITIIIPVKEGNKCDVTLDSLQNQTLKNFDIIISYDEGKGANYARNKYSYALKTPYVLFSDADINWCTDAIENLYKGILSTSSDIAYTYGWYEKDGKTHCNIEFDKNRLLKHNYISTMSLIKTNYFVGFDESIKRLQDYDLWLTLLLKHNKIGKYIGKKVFDTVPDLTGITANESVYGDYNTAIDIIRKKHKI